MASLESPKGTGINNTTTAAFALTSNTSEDINSEHKKEEIDPFKSDEKTRITNAGIFK